MVAAASLLGGLPVVLRQFFLAVNLRSCVSRMPRVEQISHDPRRP